MRAQSAFARRLAAIAGVPPERWDPILKKMARADGHDHYANHRCYIETGSGDPQL